MMIEAIYESGVFRPVGPVDLPEHSRVRVTALVGEDDPGTDEAIYEILGRRYDTGDRFASERHNEHQP